VTSTLPPPAPAAPAALPPGTASPSEQTPLSRAPDPARSHLLLTEISLWALTLAAVAGFSRIFTSWGFFAPLAVLATVGHLTAAVCRRRRLGVLTTLVVSTAAWALVSTWLFFVETTFALLPTPDTLSTARAELDGAWSAFREIVAPAPALPGFVLAAAIAVGVGCFLADWAAFRLWSAREAVVPSITLFVFATLLADDRYRTLSAVLEVSAALLFVLLHRIVTLERSDGWVHDGRARAGWSLLRGGLAVGLVAVVVGTVVAPLLPGADEEPLVDWRRDSDDSSRTLTSPMVDIHTRLVDTSETLLFTVDSTSRSYWRIAALDRFNGSRWDLTANPRRVDGDLDADVLASGADTTETVQQVTLENIETDWLPAAYQPVAFEAQDAPTVRYDQELSTFISDDPVGDGTTYEVTSAIPDLTPEQLRTARTDIPDDIGEHLELPSDFSPTAARIAREVAGAESTPYDEALALQTFFRETGGFTYSTDVDQSQGTDAIDAFLESRVGYCEQYAGTFAAMARSIGIPARVAVGYTWGEIDAANPNRYRVLGRNAHAWPEVYLGEYGWVAFEPTPGRGNPDAVSYTSVPASQESEVGAVEASTTTTSAPAASTTSTTLAGDVESAAPQSTTATADNAGTSRSFLAATLLIAVAAGLYLLAVPGTLAVRRRRRRARAGDSPAAQVGVAWSEAVDSLSSAGVRSRPDETHRELARRAGATVPAAAGPMQELAQLADAAAYGPPPSRGDGAADALASEVHIAVDAAIGPRGRLRRFLDPRPLWSTHRSRHRAG
jgi:transglutaminase-like putative cysteine protease